MDESFLWLTHLTHCKKSVKKSTRLTFCVTQKNPLFHSDCNVISFCRKKETAMQ